jgi:hypothetical protein
MSANIALQASKQDELGVSMDLGLLQCVCKDAAEGYSVPVADSSTPDKVRHASPWFRRKKVNQ